MKYLSTGFIGILLIICWYFGASILDNTIMDGLVDRQNQHLVSALFRQSFCVYAALMFFAFKKGRLVDIYGSELQASQLGPIFYISIPAALLITSIAVINLHIYSLVTPLDLARMLNSFSTMHCGPKSARLFVFLAFLLFSIVVPFSNELLFRGIIYRKLKSLVGVKTSIICSAVIFAVFYHQAPLPAFFMGIILALAYEQTGQLTLVITIHGLINTLIFLANISTQNLVSGQFDNSSSLYLPGYSITSVMLIWFFFYCIRYWPKSGHKGGSDAVSV